MGSGAGGGKGKAPTCDYAGAGSQPAQGYASLSSQGCKGFTQQRGKGIARPAATQEPHCSPLQRGGRGCQGEEEQGNGLLQRCYNRTPLGIQCSNDLPPCAIPAINHWGIKGKREAAHAALVGRHWEGVQGKRLKCTQKTGLVKIHGSEGGAAPRNPYRGGDAA